MSKGIGFISNRQLPGPKRITRTGIALVHENEIIYPAAGSEADAIQAIDDSRSRVEVYFPVEIEIREINQRNHGDNSVESDTSMRQFAQALSQS